MALKVIIIVATAGRREIADCFLQHLETQRRPPDEVVVSAPNRSHVGSYQTKHFPTSYVFGKMGLTAQRNLGIESALGRCDVITFFDDDFLPAEDYVEQVESGFEGNRGWTVVMGRAVHDGAKTRGLSFDEGLAKLRAAQVRRLRQDVTQVSDHIGAYGCNMSIRASCVGDVRFDERLVLYGWQEDIDFTSQLRRRGRVVGVSSLIGVHLGARSGRVSGVRFGYSQLVNPAYLIRKGTMPVGFAVELMGRNLAANLLRSIWPEAHVDRRGRLKGNLLAAYHLLKGRIEPEHILNL
jgi:GT2 family glycosyltransferase